MSFSLNDAFAAVKTSDGFIDRERFEHFWGIMPDDKKGGTQRESSRAIKTERKRLVRVRVKGFKIKEQQAQRKVANVIWAVGIRASKRSMRVGAR